MALLRADLKSAGTSGCFVGVGSGDFGVSVLVGSAVLSSCFDCVVAVGEAPAVCAVVVALVLLAPLFEEIEAGEATEDKIANIRTAEPKVTPSIPRLSFFFIACEKLFGRTITRIRPIAENIANQLNKPLHL